MKITREAKLIAAAAELLECIMDDGLLDRAQMGTALRLEFLTDSIAVWEATPTDPAAMVQAMHNRGWEFNTIYDNDDGTVIDAGDDEVATYYEMLPDIIRDLGIDIKGAAQ